MDLTVYAKFSSSVNTLLIHSFTVNCEYMYYIVSGKNNQKKTVKLSLRTETGNHCFF